MRNDQCKEFDKCLGRRIRSVLKWSFTFGVIREVSALLTCLLPCYIYHTAHCSHISKTFCSYLMEKKSPYIVTLAFLWNFSINTSNYFFALPEKFHSLQSGSEVWLGGSVGGRLLSFSWEVHRFVTLFQLKNREKSIYMIWDASGHLLFASNHSIIFVPDLSRRIEEGFRFSW